MSFEPRCSDSNYLFPYTSTATGLGYIVCNNCSACNSPVNSFCYINKRCCICYVAGFCPDCFDRDSEACSFCEAILANQVSYDDGEGGEEEEQQQPKQNQQQ